MPSKLSDYYDAQVQCEEGIFRFRNKHPEHMESFLKVHGEQITLKITPSMPSTLPRPLTSNTSMIAGMGIFQRYDGNWYEVPSFECFWFDGMGFIVVDNNYPQSPARISVSTVRRYIPNKKLYKLEQERWGAFRAAFGGLLNANLFEVMADLVVLGKASKHEAAELLVSIGKSKNVTAAIRSINRIIDQPHINTIGQF